MDFGSLSRREAQIYVEAYADGIEAFSGSIDLMKTVYGDFIPYSDLKGIIGYLVEGHRNRTMARVMSIYDAIERSDESFRM